MEYQDKDRVNNLDSVKKGICIDFDINMKEETVQTNVYQTDNIGDYYDTVLVEDNKKQSPFEQKDTSEMNHILGIRRGLRYFHNKPLDEVYHTATNIVLGDGWKSNYRVQLQLTSTYDIQPYHILGQTKGSELSHYPYLRHLKDIESKIQQQLYDTLKSDGTKLVGIYSVCKTQCQLLEDILREDLIGKE